MDSSTAGAELGPVGYSVRRNADVNSLSLDRPMMCPSVSP
jgi:hypothetical protein